MEAPGFWLALNLLLWPWLDLGIEAGQPEPYIAPGKPLTVPGEDLSEV